MEATPAYACNVCHVKALTCCRWQQWVNVREPAELLLLSHLSAQPGSWRLLHGIPCICAACSCCKWLTRWLQREFLILLGLLGYCQCLAAAAVLICASDLRCEKLCGTAQLLARLPLLFCILALAPAFAIV